MPKAPASSQQKNSKSKRSKPYNRLSSTGSSISTEIDQDSLYQNDYTNGSSNFQSLSPVSTYQETNLSHCLPNLPTHLIEMDSAHFVSATLPTGAVKRSPRMCTNIRTYPNQHEWQKERMKRDIHNTSKLLN